MDQTAAIGLAGAEAAIRGREPWIIDIRTVPAPRLTPALDAICRRHAAAADFVQLLTAPAGYRPSIRLDLKGGKGFVWPPHMTGRRLNGATSGARP